MKLFESSCGLRDGSVMPEVAGVFLPRQERRLLDVPNCRNSLFYTLTTLHAIEMTKILPGEWLSGDIINAVTEILCEEKMRRQSLSLLKLGRKFILK